MPIKKKVITPIKMGLVCGKCDYWLQDPLLDKDHGWCKRYPKVVLGFDLNSNPLSSHGIEPRTEPACGEYKRLEG